MVTAVTEPLAGRLPSSLSYYSLMLRACWIHNWAEVTNVRKENTIYFKSLWKGILLLVKGVGLTALETDGIGPQKRDLMGSSGATFPHLLPPPQCAPTVSGVI